MDRKPHSRNFNSINMHSSAYFHAVVFKVERSENRWNRQLLTKTDNVSFITDFTEDKFHYKSFQ